MAEIMINFDSGIENVTIDYGSINVTHSESGYGTTLDYEPGNDIVLTPTLKTGYSLKDAVITKTNVGTITGTISGNVVTIPESDIQWDSSFAVNLITQGEIARKSYDLSTSAKWATLSSGNHNVQIVAKASGYLDSEKSAAAVVKKAYPNVTLKAGTYEFKENPVLPTEEFSATMAFTSLPTYISTQTFSSMTVNSSALTYIYPTGDVINAYTTAAATWIDSGWRTITITEDVQVPSDFLTWFENNTYVPLKAGTYQFIAQPAISSPPSNIYIPFTSDSVAYIKIAFLTDGMHYVKTSDTSDNLSLTVYSASTGWTDEKYRVITVTADTFIYRAQYTWFTANTSPYTPTYTLEAGTYEFANDVPYSTKLIQQALIFSSYPTNGISDYVGLAITANTLAFKYVLDGADKYINVNRSIDNPVWKNDGYKTITLSTAQTVSAKFYNWAITDGNLVKQEDPTSEIWLLNETLTPSINLTVNFISNNISYTSLHCAYNDDPLDPTLYLSYGIPGDTNYKQVYLGHWLDGLEAYRTLTFSTPPTGNLLTWLQANGTKQGGGN